MQVGHLVECCNDHGLGRRFRARKGFWEESFFFVWTVRGPPGPFVTQKWIEVQKFGFVAVGVYLRGRCCQCCVHCSTAITVSLTFVEWLRVFRVWRCKLKFFRIVYTQKNVAMHTIQKSWSSCINYKTPDCWTLSTIPFFHSYRNSKSHFCKTLRANLII